MGLMRGCGGGGDLEVQVGGWLELVEPNWLAADWASLVSRSGETVGVLAELWAATLGLPKCDAMWVGKMVGPGLF